MKEYKILRSIHSKSKTIVWTNIVCIGLIFIFLFLFNFVYETGDNTTFVGQPLYVFYIVIAVIDIVISFATSISVLTNCLRLPDNFKEKSTYQVIAIASIFLLWIVLSFWFVSKTKKELAKYKKDTGISDGITSIPGDGGVTFATDKGSTFTIKVDGGTPTPSKGVDQGPYDFPPPKL